ncbi:MAG: type VI secretion system Vgr family protein [Pseudomonadales bacterium]
MSLRQRNTLKGIVGEPSSSQLVVKDEAGTQYVAADLNVTEKLSELTRVEVALISEQGDIASWLGQSISCEVFDQVSSSREAVRSYRGVVTKVEVLSNYDQGKDQLLGLTVEPWLALLQYSRNYRVFQQQSSRDIVSSLFDELGFKGKYEINAMPTTQREYCLQFDESDYDFVCRILAEEGVHFYFGRDADSNTLYLQDAAKPFLESDKFSFDFLPNRTGSEALLKRWAPRFNYHAGALALAGYDDSQSKLVASSEQKSSYTLAANSKLVERNYPVASISGKFDDLTAALVKTRRAQLDAEHALIEAGGENFLICSGNYINLASHADPSQLGDYLVVSSAYTYSIDSDGGLSCQVQFNCTPKAHAHYPAYLRKPQAQGMYSAVVAGTKEGEPSCDEQGRIKIKFHWDDSDGDKTSCWVRVAQALAGNGYGLQFIPRAGQEVLVSFLESDIDRPVVTSSLYNSTHQAAYPEAETTQSGIKTQLDGLANELRFDDKKDSEQLYLHAAKDYLLEIENDRAIKVLNDATEEVAGNQSVSVEKDIEISTEQNYSLSATEQISGKGKSIALEADDTISLKVGGSELTISSSKIELKSSEISLKGDSKVSIEGMQVAVKGTTKVDISSSASMSLKATADFKAGGLNAELSGDVGATVKGNAMAEVSASGMTTVKGGVVMVN